MLGRSERTEGGTWRGKALVALVLGAIALLPFLPLLSSIPKSHDLPDHLAMAAEFREGLAEGRIYPRWFGDLNRGWGEPTANYYPPGLYYVTALTTAICGGDLASGLFGALAILSAAGAAGLYLLTRPVAGRPLALLACALFAAAPFRAFELYAAGLFSAHAAGCLVPWLLLSLWKLASHPALTGAREMIRRAGPFALAFSLIAFFNLPCATMIAYLAGTWALIEGAVQRSWRIPVRVALGGAWGALMAGAFLIPAVLELPLVTPPLAGGDEVVRSNFIFGGEGGLSPGIHNLFDRMGGLQGLVLILGAGLVARRALRPGAGGTGQGRRVPAVWLRLVAGFGAAALFLATPASAWLWQGLPFLHRVYFPWRFLDLLALSMAALGAGGAASLLARGERVPGALRTGGLGALGLLGAIALLLSVSIFHMNGSISREDVQALPGLFCHRTGYFLPRGAKTPDLLDRHPLVEVLSPTTRGEVLEWSSGRRRLRLSSEGPARIALRTYYFPGWTARTAAGEPVLVRGSPPTGRIELEVPRGDQEVILSFEDTPVRTGGAIITVLALLAWTVAFILTRRKPARKAPATAEAPRAVPAIPFDDGGVLPPEEDRAPRLVTSLERKGEE